MHGVRFSRLLVLIALSACTEQNYYTTEADSLAEPGADAASSGATVGDAEAQAPGTDAGASTTGGPATKDAAVSPGAATIRITVPAAVVTQVTGTVSLQMAVEGASPERVELWVDGELLAALPLPYQFAWDTSPYAEGPHTLMARAVRDGAALAEVTRQLVVDRTRPELLRMIPESGTKALSLSEPVVLVFSEPIAADSIVDGITIVMGGRLQAFSATLQADPSRVELRMQKPAPLLPATATINVGPGIRDLAGTLLRPSTPLSASFPAWRPLGSPIEKPFYVSDVASNGKALWALLREHDSTAQITHLSAMHWDAKSREWLREAVSKPPMSVSRSALTVDADGLPVVYFSGAASGQATQHALKRRLVSGNWSDLPPPPDFASASGVNFLGAEPNGSLVIAPYYSDVTKAFRLSGVVWSPIGGPIPGQGIQAIITESGLAVAHGACRIWREAANGWYDYGTLQANGGCSEVSLFARPGSSLGAFVRYSVRSSSGEITDSYAVYEHDSQTKWIPPTFGVPAAARYAVRSQDDLLFVAQGESSIYDSRVEPLVRELPPFVSGKAVVWEGAPVVVSGPESFGPLFPSNGAVRFYELNRIK